MPDVPHVAVAEAAHRPRRVVDDEEIEVAVAVVVEERGLGRVALVRDAVLAGHLLEPRRAVARVALVDPQLVGPTLRIAGACATQVDVESPVAVHVGEHHARRPRTLLGFEPCRLRDVAEAEAPEVEVDARTVLVGREHDLGERVAGEVADRDAAAVVEVPIREDVVLAALHQPVLERDAGVRRRQSGEQRRAHGRRGGVARAVIGRALAGTARGDDATGEEQQSPNGRSHEHPRWVQGVN